MASLIKIKLQIKFLLITKTKKEFSLIQQRLLINKGSPKLILINYYMFVLQIYCMITKLIPYFIFLLAIPCMSQNLTLTGIVKDLNNQPIAYANVTLYNEEGTTFFNGTTTDELGVFRIEVNSINSYTVKISFLGFSEYEKIFNINKDIEFSYPKTEIPKENAKLWVAEGDSTKQTVAIFLQGGPKDVLNFEKRGKSVWRYLPDYQNYYSIPFRCCFS